MMTVSSSAAAASSSMMGIYAMEKHQPEQQVGPEQSAAVSATKPAHQTSSTTATTAEDSCNQHQQSPRHQSSKNQKGPKRHSSLQAALSKEKPKAEQKETDLEIVVQPTKLEIANVSVPAVSVEAEQAKPNHPEEVPVQVINSVENEKEGQPAQEKVAPDQKGDRQEVKSPEQATQQQGEHAVEEIKSVEKLETPAKEAGKEEQSFQVSEQEDIKSELSENTELEDSFLVQSVSLHCKYPLQESKGDNEKQLLPNSPQESQHAVASQVSREHLSGQLLQSAPEITMSNPLSASAVNMPLNKAVPFLISQVETLQATVRNQQQTIEASQESIQMLHKTLEGQHASTQQMLQGILQAVSSKSTPDTTPRNGNEEPKEEIVTNQRQRPRRTSAIRPTFKKDYSTRSIDAEFRPPAHRHDSLRRQSRDETKPSEQEQQDNQQGEQTEQTDEGSHHSLDHNEITFSPQQAQKSVRPCEIQLDGSHHSFDRNHLPDMDNIFARRDQPKDTDSPASIKPPTRPDRKASTHARTTSQTTSAHSRPLEIILEGPVGDGQQLKLPAGPEELFPSSSPTKTPEVRNLVNNSKSNSKRWNDSINDARTDIDIVPASTGSRPNLVGSVLPRDGCDLHISAEDMAKMQLSAVTLDSAIFDNGAHHSKSEETQTDEYGTDVQSESDEDDDKFELDDLQMVRGYHITDMYGDRGTFSGTLDENGAPSGFGSMKYESGRFFKGEWKDGRWNGKGTLLNANGDSYQGEFLNDARHGRGIYRFTSGDVYEGEFTDDNRHGEGVFKFHNGSVYAGEFYMGSFEGQGRYEFDGGFYEGGWRRDEYYGGGRLEYKDGSRYTGNFKRGAAHGFGEETLADGTMRRGLWKKGEFIEECTAAEANTNQSFATNRSRGSRRNNGSNRSLLRKTH